MQGDAGHVSAEDDLLCPAGMGEVCHRCPRFRHQGVREPAGFEGAFVVGVGMHQVAGHALQAGLRHLRSSGIIQEDRRSLQGGELLADQG